MSKELFLSFYYNTKSTKMVPITNLDYETLVGLLPKVYVDNYEVVNLPKPNNELFKIRNISDVMLKRRSVREFLRKPISLEELSTLLYYSMGIRSYVNAYGFKNFPLRMFPSSGGLSETEAYIVPFSVDGLRQYNVYHYNAIYHALENINADEKLGEILYRESLQSLPVTETYPALLIVLTACFGKVIEKYKERGARFVLIDTGIVVENIYLVATALGLGVVAIGGLPDDIAEKALKVNPEKDLEAPMIGLLIGIPRDQV